MIIILNIAIFSLASAVGALVLARFIGVAALILPCLTLAYLVYAYANAHKIVAHRAGFRLPTPVQERYLNFLGIKEQVWTHPSLIIGAAVVCTHRERLLLLTAGAIRYLRDEEIREISARLLARDRNPVFSWVFHLATGGVPLFAAAGPEDKTGHWARLIGLAATVLSVLVLIILMMFTFTLSGRTLPVSTILLLLAVPLWFLVGWHVYVAIVRIVAKYTMVSWNQPVTLKEVTFAPLSAAISHNRLYLLKDGLLEARGVPEMRASCPEPVTV